MQNLIITENDLTNSKIRLDSYLSLKLQSSKNQIQNLIKNHFVLVNGKICNKNGYAIGLNDTITILSPTTESVESADKNTAFCVDDEKFAISIIYEDEDILIINKPPHLVIHEAPSVKESTLVDWLKFHSYRFHTLSGNERYGIVHRLDKQTSGALAIAKTPLAYQNLSHALKTREMGRYYLAIIDTPLKNHQDIECFMGRSPHNRLKMSKIHIPIPFIESDITNTPHTHIPKGIRYSKSSMVKLATSDNGALELIAIKLHTGRTHQIRVHLESLSRHILGDTLYGYKPSAKTFFYQNRILLHAYILYLNHPKTSQKMFFKAPILTDMLEFIQTHFTKDFNGCKDITEMLETDRIMHSFDVLS